MLAAAGETWRVVLIGDICGSVRLGSRLICNKSADICVRGSSGLDRGIRSSKLQAEYDIQLFENYRTITSIHALAKICLVSTRKQGTEEGGEGTYSVCEVS